MALGCLKKVGDFFRNVGSGIATGVKKAVNFIREAALKVVKVANALAPIAALIMNAVLPGSDIAFTGGIAAANTISNLIKK
jgi:hypothetical protein